MITMLPSLAYFFGLSLVKHAVLLFDKVFTFQNKDNEHA